VEASRPEKHWARGKWLALADALKELGIAPLWSAGPSGREVIRSIDPGSKYPAVGNGLDVAQLWNLVAGASLLVCPDTGVSHMGKLAGTPTVTLYGPGAAALFGRGEFWRDALFRELTDPQMAPRAPVLFKREIHVKPQHAPALEAKDVLATVREIVR
jgi:ADP-heptose:LPS heptosyltransferase